MHDTSSTGRAAPVALVAAAVLVIALIGAWLVATDDGESPREVERASDTTEDATVERATLDLDVPTAPGEPVRTDAGRTVASTEAADSSPAAPSTGTIRATVRSLNNCLLVDGITVETYRRGPGHDTAPREEGPDAMSDSDGRLELTLEAGVLWALSIDEDTDHAGEWLEIDALSPGEVREVLIEITTHDDVEWHGRVTWRGRPRGGVTVRLVQFEGDSSRVLDETESDPTGHVRFVGSSWKSQDVQAIAPELGVAIAELVDGHETPEKAQVLPLWPYASIRAEVTGVGGEPLQGVEVIAICRSWWLDAPGSGYPSSPPPRVTATTNADGVAFLTDVVAEAPTAFQLWMNGKIVLEEVASLVVEAGEQATKRFVIGGAGRVTGTVVGLDGKPLADVQVELYEYHNEGHDRLYHVEYFATNAERKTRTDEFGAFAIDEVAYGPWFVGTFGKGESDRFAMARQVVLTAERPEGSVRLVFETGPMIAGVVVEPDGTPVEGVHVQCWSEAEGSIGRETSAEDGSVRFGPMPPGTYNVWIRSPDGFVSNTSRLVEAGTEDLRLELVPGVRLDGLVVDAADGSPIESCRVTAYAPTSDRPYAFHGNTHVRDGAFTLTSLPEGEIALRATTDDGGLGILRGLVVEHDGENRTATIRLHRGVPVRVRYVGEPAEGLAILAVQDGVAVSYASAHPGEAQEFFAVPGKLTLRAMQDQVMFDEVEVNVRADEQEVIEFGGAK